MTNKAQMWRATRAEPGDRQSAIRSPPNRERRTGPHLVAGPHVLKQHRAQLRERPVPLEGPLPALSEEPVPIPRGAELRGAAGQQLHGPGSAVRFDPGPVPNTCSRTAPPLTASERAALPLSAASAPLIGCCPRPGCFLLASAQEGRYFPHRWRARGAAAPNARSPGPERRAATGEQAAPALMFSPVEPA